MGTIHDDLLVHGVAAAKAGERKEARFYLEWLLRLNPGTSLEVEALYWLSEVAETPAEARSLLEDLLARDPFDLRARRKLGILDGKIQAAPAFNPDTYQQPAPQAARAANGQRFTCPKCGGRLTYSPDGSALVCEYCESRQAVNGKSANRAAVREEDFLAAMVSGRGHWLPKAELSLRCSGCGATFIVPPARLSMNCPYCGSAHTTKEPAAELILPTQILPFTVSEAMAKQALRIWLGEHFSAEWPRLARGLGLYLPAWVFRISGILPWSAEIKRQKEWVVESGNRYVDLADLRVSGTPRLGKLWKKALEGYNLLESQPFEEGYLADWPAETYQVQLGDASLEAREAALIFSRQQVEDGIFEQHRNLSVNSTDLIVESFQLVLLPAWLTHYQAEDGQRVEVIINGQSGAVLSGSTN